MRDVYPLATNTPFTTTITVYHNTTGAQVSRTTVTVDQCNAPSAITSNQTVGGGAGNVAAVPTLGAWGLLLTGLGAAGIGARRLRRRGA